MSQSLVKNFIHIVFSTKYRQALINTQIEDELFSYIGGICNEMECRPVKIGGFNDHVHVLCMLSKKVTLVKLIEEIKASSSKWIKTKGIEYKNFYWQNGYGVFSVSPSVVKKVAVYIENQKDHHKTKTFRSEYLAFLKKYKVEYDEQYLWE
jgi:putative transposase